MQRVVLIPQNYEHLSYSQRKPIIPICIAAFDQYDQPIAPAWFSRGIAPVRQQLVGIAQHVMGDPWCVSELAEATVHRLWARHGSEVGRYPARRVLKSAMWIGQELMAGDWRRLRYPGLYLALDALDEKIRDQLLADPKQYAELFEQQIMVDRVQDSLEHAGLVEMRSVCELLRRGYSWDEVAKQVGAPGAEQVKRRFYRWRKRAFGG